MLVMEQAIYDALDSFLSKNGQFPQEKRVEVTCQAAWGIEYPHKRYCIHRAALNCLCRNGNMNIAECGLSRLGETYQMNPKTKVPIRWLAPETLNSAV